jgi:predicted enzyme related to lactoylglutathione lyase
MTGSSSPLVRISQIAINARDVARAEAFYRDVLRLKHLFSVPGMSFFDCGGVRLMLAKPEKPEFDHPSSVIYFQVEDIEAVHASLAARDVRFEATPHLVAKLPHADLWMGFFRDPEGNLLALSSERPRA